MTFSEGKNVERATDCSEGVTSIEKDFTGLKQELQVQPSQYVELERRTKCRTTELEAEAFLERICIGDVISPQIS